MYKELVLFDPTLSENDMREAIFLALKKNFSGISLSLASLQTLKDFIPQGIVIACPIDFPDGISDLQSRNTLCLNALRRGATSIDVVVPNHLIANKLVKKAKDDLLTKQQMCEDNGGTLRVAINYEDYSSEQIGIVIDLLAELNIEYLIPSVKYHISVADQILTAHLMQKLYGDLKIILNANINTQEHLDKLVKNRVFGFKLHSIYTLKSLYGV